MLEVYFTHGDIIQLPRVRDWCEHLGLDIGALMRIIVIFVDSLGVSCWALLGYALSNKIE